jgi:hypothetical protein
MMKLSKDSPCVAVWLLLIGVCFASSVITPERGLLRGAAVAINVHKVGNNETPRNWDELSVAIDLKHANQLFLALYGRRFDESYQFVADVPWHGYEGGKIILIRSIPLKEGMIGARWVYRYCLYETPSGEIVDFKGSEDQLQKAFLAAGKPLTQVPRGNIETERGGGTKWSEPTKMIAVASSIIAFTALFLVIAKGLRRRYRRSSLPAVML